MTELVFAIIALYIIVALFVFIVSIVSYFDPTMVDFKKYFAFGMLVAPVWPLVLPLVLAWFIYKRINAL